MLHVASRLSVSCLLCLCVYLPLIACHGLIKWNFIRKKDRIGYNLPHRRIISSEACLDQLFSGILVIENDVRQLSTAAATATTSTIMLVDQAYYSPGVHLPSDHTGGMWISFGLFDR
jgi:hypothetical protein